MFNKFEPYSVLSEKKVRLPDEKGRLNLNASKSDSKNSNYGNSSKRAHNSSSLKTHSSDRFIPDRSAMNFSKSNFLLTNSIGSQVDKHPTTIQDIDRYEYHRNVTANIMGEESNDTKILTYSKKMPPSIQALNAKNDVVFVASKFKKDIAYRRVVNCAEKVLDAPELITDYYVHLMDWSSKNTLAVALGNTVYLWDVATQKSTILTDLKQSETDYPASVRWTDDGKTLAIGTFSHQVQLWNVEQSKKLRTMKGHSARVGSLSWNEHILSSASRAGYIHHHDVRIAQHCIGKWAAHSQEVCGLAWSPFEGKYLASGSNDNTLKIWSKQFMSSNLEDRALLHNISDHKAAVRAISWCPWKLSTLASGAGTADKRIQIWNGATGECMKSIDSGSQVCDIVWSEQYKEIASSHGYNQNHISLWKYPQMTKVTDLQGHTGRVLHMSLSSDKTTLSSIGSDETIRFWNVFPPVNKNQLHANRINHESKLDRIGRL